MPMGLCLPKGAYNSNMECLRHLASQVAVHCLTTPPTSCLEGSMEWFRNLLKDGFRVTIWGLGFRVTIWGLSRGSEREVGK